MDEKQIKDLLQKYKGGEIDENIIVNKLRNLPYEDIGHTKVDHHRVIRNGYPEIIYCEGKTVEQISDVIGSINKSGENVFGTRVKPEQYEKLKDIFPNISYDSVARTIYIRNKDVVMCEGTIAVITAGTSDIPVAEEAVVTAEVLGNKVDRIYDVGVAGIHRLLNNRDRMNEANVLIVVAGMEGALASVVGGMTDKPVIAVPTSVGYGASFEGLSALLTMLNSCASGVGVVNIDNGFGAAYLAATINRL